MPDTYNPYQLPTVNFVGGESQDLAFHMYFYSNGRPFSLSGCTANFAIVSFLNKTGSTMLSKSMDIEYDDDLSIDNILTITLDPSETVDLAGKYIYQITIRDIDGGIEIPKQGLLYIINNINKSWI